MWRKVTAKKRAKTIANEKRLSRLWPALGIGVVVIIGGIYLTHLSGSAAKQLPTYTASTSRDNLNEENGNQIEQVKKASIDTGPIDLSSIKSKELAKLIATLQKATRIDVSYDYFNDFEPGYVPSTVTNERHIQLILALLAKGNTSSISEKDMGGNYIKNQPIVFYQEGKKLAELYMNYDTLYDKGWIQYGDYNYEIDEKLFRLLAATEEYRATDREVPTDVITLFGEYGYTPAFLGSSSERTLPKSLEVESAADIENLYFAMGMEMSKAIGLNYGGEMESAGVLGQAITVEIYYLVEPLPESARPMVDARGIVIRHKGNIVSAHINVGRHAGAFYTLSGKSFEEVTSSTPANYLAETIMAGLDRGNLSDEELIAAYFKAMVEGDTSAYFKTVSTCKWLEILFANMDNSTLFNEATTRALIPTIYKKVEILDMKLSKENEALSTNQTKIYTVNYRIETNDPITLDSGEYSRSVVLTNENGKWLVLSEGF